MRLFDLDLYYGLVNTAKSVTYNGMPVAYDGGNIEALMKWIEATNKNQIEKALGIKEVPKYPLIWLVEGWKMVEATGGYDYKKVAFHIAVNSAVETLNRNRKPNFEIVYEVAEKFIEQMKFRGIKISPNIELTTRSNFHVSNRESHTIDVWDTLIVQMDIFINKNCLCRLKNN